MLPLDRSLHLQGLCVSDISIQSPKAASTRLACTSRKRVLGSLRHATHPSSPPPPAVSVASLAASLAEPHEIEDGFARLDGFDEAWQTTSRFGGATSFADFADFAVSVRPSGAGEWTVRDEGQRTCGLASSPGVS